MQDIAETVAADVTSCMPVK